MAKHTATRHEEWRPIPHHPGYEASSLGRIRSVDRVLGDGRRWKGRVLALRSNGQGYRVVALALGGRRRFRHAGAHALVAEAFLGPRPTAAHLVAHYDGNPANNAVENLRWATPVENAQDRDRHGRTARLKGHLHGCAKLSEDAVRQLRRLKASGSVSVDHLAQRFGVSRWTVFDALSGRTWSHL